MPTALWVIVTSCVLAASQVAQAPTAEAGPVVCRVTTERNTAVAGETLRLEISLHNRSERSIRVPFARYKPFERTRVLCRTPSGELLRWVPNARKIPTVSPPEPGCSHVSIDAGESASLAKITFRLSTNLKRWRPVGSDAVKVKSLRVPGLYRFWASYEVPKPSSPIDGMWCGRALGLSVPLKLSARVPKRRPLDAKVGADLQAYAQRGDFAAYLRVCRALERANETLIERMIEVHGEGPPRKRGLWQLLAYYAGGRNFHRGIVPGCVSPSLAALVRAAVENAELGEQRWSSSHGVTLLTSHLLLNPDDHAVRSAVEAQLRASAKLAEPKDMHLNVAWDALIDLGILHDGMSLVDAQKILGEPTRMRRAWLLWRVKSSRQVNPALSAQLRDGKVFGFWSSKG